MMTYGGVDLKPRAVLTKTLAGGEKSDSRFIHSLIRVSKMFRNNNVMCFVTAFRQGPTSSTSDG